MIIYMKDNFVALKLLVCNFCCSFTFVDLKLSFATFQYGLGSTEYDKVNTTPTTDVSLLHAHTHPCTHTYTMYIYI